MNFVGSSPSTRGLNPRNSFRSLLPVPQKLRGRYPNSHRIALSHCLWIHSDTRYALFVLLGVLRRHYCCRWLFEQFCFSLDHYNITAKPGGVQGEHDVEVVLQVANLLGLGLAK